MKLGKSEMRSRGLRIGGPGGEGELGHRAVGMVLDLILHGDPRAARRVEPSNRVIVEIRGPRIYVR